MVTAAQLALTQSPISSLIPSVGNTVTVKLDDSNYVTWNFQISLLLEGNGIMGFLDGTIPCPQKYTELESDDESIVHNSPLTDAYQVWQIHDKALMTLITATLSTAALSCVIGCRSSSDMWNHLKERFAHMSRTSIVQLKIDLQNIKKGSESIDAYLQRIKECRDQLAIAGVVISDEDIVIVALRGLPTDYNTIKSVIRGRESLVSLKELRSQLKADESTLEEGLKQPHLMAAMFANASNTTYETGGSSNSRPYTGNFDLGSHTGPYTGGSSFSPMAQFQQLPFPNGHVAFVSQTGSRTYNNFRGTNYRNKGKGKRFNTGFQQPSGHQHFAQPSLPSQSQFQNSGSQMASGQSFQPLLICQICDKKGHVALNCFQNGCQICHRKGHTAATCFDRNNTGSLPMSTFSSSPMMFPQHSYSQNSSQLQPHPHSSPSFSSPVQHPTMMSSSQYPNGMMSPPNNSQAAFTARTNFSPSAPTHEYWLLDSGATNHMTSDLSNLQAVTPYASSETVIGANGEGLQISYIGQACLSTPSHTLELNSVLHVPQLSQHLLSMYQLCKDNNCRCIVDEFSVCIQDKVTNKVLYQGLSNQAVYPLPLLKPPKTNPAAFLGQKINDSLWHCRLGHPTNSVLQVALSKSAITSSCNSPSQTCTACLQGKFTKLPFPVMASKSFVPFEVIHTDVWGPSPTKSIEGYSYYVSFIDECTRYTWIFPMNNKAAVFEIFVQFHAYIQNYFSATVKVLQSDGGGEYVSTRFQNFLTTKGIVHQKSCLYTPEQNGLAERKNRHLVETAVTLLQKASLSSKFWFHACATSTYLVNRLPTSVLKMHSPFEVLYKSPPTLDHLRVFGCACYPSLKPYRTNKLDPKTTMCIFLGYAAQYKGYICYAISDNKLIVSRHVLFDESVFPSTYGLSSSSFSSTVSSASIPVSLAPPTTFSHPPFIPIPFPHISSHPSVTLSDFQQLGDLGPTGDNSASRSASSLLLSESHPDVTSSQVPDLQHVYVVSSNTHPMQTRSKSGIFKKKVFSAVVHEDVKEPQSFSIAARSSQWRQAMTEEMDALIKQHTWTLVPLPSHKNLVGCKWIYKVKRNPDGSVARYKARLVAKGFSQEAGLDYYETFSPVVKPTTVRLMLSLAATKGWKLKQLDVKNAFLHGFLDEEVYMSQPQGFIDKDHPDFVCKLERSLYGLKQAPRAWNARFSSFLLSLGFTSSYADLSLYVKRDGPSLVVLLLYVDDIILSGDDDVHVQSVISQLTREFDMKDLGVLHYFLGLQIEYQPQGLLVHQSKYIRDLLHKVHMFDSKPCTTPCHPHQKLLNHGSPPFHDPGLYRSIVGALQYLTFTRPDIAYSVNQVCQFMHSPLDSHFVAVKRILRYLKGSLHLGLCFQPGNLDIRAYTDADWAGDPNDRRSTTGFVVFLGDNPISWSSKKQHTVSRSSTEAEYRAMATTTAEVVWIQQLLQDLSLSPSTTPLLHCDNISAMALATNPILHSKAKHIEIDCHFVRERVQQGTIMLQFVNSSEQFADILTKGLCFPLFSSHCNNLMLANGQHKIEGEC
ncbi:hypothetical protein ACFXTH_005260 [Malus domestica]